MIKDNFKITEFTISDTHYENITTNVFIECAIPHYLPIASYFLHIYFLFYLYTNTTYTYLSKYENT